jgi:hypothetical protein
VNTDEDRHRRTGARGCIERRIRQTLQFGADGLGDAQVEVLVVHARRRRTRRILLQVTARSDLCPVPRSALNRDSCRKYAPEIGNSDQQKYQDWRHEGELDHGLPRSKAAASMSADTIHAHG